MLAATLRGFLVRYTADVILTLPEVLTSTELSVLRRLVQAMRITELPAYQETAALEPRMPFCPFAGAAEHHKTVHLVHRRTWR